MTAISPPAEAIHPPQSTGEGLEPKIADARFKAFGPTFEPVFAQSTLLAPTPVLAGAILAVGLTVLVLPSGTASLAAIMGFGAIAAGFLIDVIGLPRRSGLTLGRLLPAVFSLHHRHEFELELRSRSSRCRGTLVQSGISAFEVLRAGEEEEPAGGFSEPIRPEPGRESRVRLEIRPRLRGRHRFPVAVARITGRFGLAARRFTFDPHDEIHVYPDLDDVKRAEMALRRSRFLETGLRTRRFVGEGTEFESLRDYHADDDIRHINWHATARLRRPITNQYRIDRNQTVITVIDCGRLMSTPVGNSSRLDIALANAAGVAHVCGKLEDRIGAVAFDNRIRADLAPRRGNVQSFLAALYDIEYSLNESDYDLALARVASQKRALVLVFTDVLEEGATRPLAAALPSLVRRHQVVVASVRDPEIDEAMEIIPRTTEDAYRQAGAIGVLEHRAKAIRMITALGADVVEAPPKEMTASLINAYLRLKARLRL